jgi:hypothetical protein
MRILAARLKSCPVTKHGFFRSKPVFQQPVESRPFKTSALSATEAHTLLKILFGRVKSFPLAPSGVIAQPVGLGIGSGPMGGVSAPNLSIDAPGWGIEMPLNIL